MSERTSILDDLFLNAEELMAELSAKDGRFSNQALLRRITRDRQVAYIDLLYSFRDTTNHSPFFATHAEIGSRIKKVAEAAGYVPEPGPYAKTDDLFGGPTPEKFYRRAQG